MIQKGTGMLIETVRDNDFADDVREIAWSIREKRRKKQFVARIYKLDLEKWLKKITEGGGHIDQVISYDDGWLIVYTAEDKLMPERPWR